MKKILFAVLALSCGLFMASCSDPALDAEYGQTLVYMPQATHNIGVDNNLTVNVSAAALNSAPDHQTETTLGIYRSGTAPKESFSVDLKVVPDTLAAAKAIAMGEGAPAKYNIYKTGVLLDAKYYEPLPEKLTVAAGERQATTKLVLDDAALVADYAVGQVLLLPVRIENPTRYQLNESLAFTMVVVNITD